MTNLIQKLQDAETGSRKLDCFIMKAYIAIVPGYSAVTIFAKNKSQARMRCFNSFRSSHNNMSFKDFLKMRVHISETVETPRYFGREIQVDDYEGSTKKAYVIEHRGNTVSCVWPNSDNIMNYHELDTNIAALRARQENEE